jgi:putative DNA methylase
LIPKGCKRLAEVDFPIAVVSKHAAREKSIRHGHPSTLHLWWARRPLASSRAVLLGLLLPDPWDPLCPDEFKAKAREVLPRVQGPVGAPDEALRAALLRFIGDFASWDFARNAAYLEVGRALVAAAYPDGPPLVVDPFAGGGSIPLEALRMDSEAFASDLNPVACLQLKVLLEDIPRLGQQLAETLRDRGAEVISGAERDLGIYFPRDPDGRRPIAYLWARTVRCETPKCGAEIPLLRSLWLSSRAEHRVALRPQIARAAGHAPEIDFEVFEPAAERDVAAGTVRSGKATCPACRTVLPGERVRAQLTVQRGGTDVEFDTSSRRVGGARLIAVVTQTEGERLRGYRPPKPSDYEAVRRSKQAVESLVRDWDRGHDGISPVPDERINTVRPSPNARGVSAVTRYGMATFGDLFTARQKLVLVTLARLVRAEAVSGSGPTHRALLTLISRAADYGSSGVVWAAGGEFVAHTFGRQALPMVWDFAEAVPFTDSSGSLWGALDWIVRVIEAWPDSRVGQTQVADAAEYPLPSESAEVWFTDPPYYDAIPYADLSDYFLVWLKRAVTDGSMRDPFDNSNPLAPKGREIVWNNGHLWNGIPKDKAFFESAIARSFAEGRRVLSPDGIGAVVFAHQTTEGWEAFLGGLTAAGWTVTASWPIATERAARVRARQNASLATSVHLVCRPRDEDATVGDWGDVLRELPLRVGDWMARLQSEGVRGADLVFACIGPALEIFSRYSRVEATDGRQIALGEYLEKVWEVVGRAALNRILGTGEHGAGAFEEDARLTALFLWTLQSTNGGAGGIRTQVTVAEAASEGPDEQSEGDDGIEESTAASSKTKGYTLVYDVVRRFAQPLGIRLDSWEDRVIETKKGTVRLLAIDERGVALLGAAGARTLVTQPNPTPSPQLSLFDTGADDTVPTSLPATVGDARRASAGRRDPTTLDRVHLAMLLQRGGQAAALRNLLATEQDRGPEFLRLANALSALYPRESEEKRLLDAMLLAVPR